MLRVLVIRSRVTLNSSPNRKAIFPTGQTTSSKTRLVTTHQIKLLIPSAPLTSSISPTRTKHLWKVTIKTTPRLVSYLNKASLENHGKITIKSTPRLASYLQVLSRQLLHSGHRVVLVRVVQPRRQRLFLLQWVVQVVLPPGALLLICFTEVLHLPVHLPLGHPESREALPVSRAEGFVL